MPVPMIVFARLKTDDATEALPPERTPPRSSSDGESAEFLRSASVVGAPEMDSVSSIAGIFRRRPRRSCAAFTARKKTGNSAL